MAQINEFTIKLCSFGYSFGVSQDMDLLYSIRHLPMTNVENYQRYDGRHKRIQNELLSMPEYENMIKSIMDQLMNFVSNRKSSSISVAVGCEEGQHRSVAVVERLAELLSVTCHVEVNHRDLQRTRYDKKKQRERITKRDTKYNQYDEDC
ncbi:unnamed protein product [Adineta ricciae]|uniref:RapZ C-terminal domain-containing protein n=1 Tax=Adineta ricciae TaxID=249248 RepID=A0A813S1M1_ADIRI|nr:unnamed protein product [Adineta ricciae]CAF0955915.1 unnamed protein product [Adineta ricciae]